MTTEARYERGDEVEYLGRPAVVIADGVVGATGAVVYGVRFQDGGREGRLAAHDLLSSACGYCGGRTTRLDVCDSCGVAP